MSDDEQPRRAAVDPLDDTRAESILPGKLLAGAPIGGYHLEYVLGEGGMGVVWCARDPLLDRTIAIKVLRGRDAHASMRTRLLREAQAMARLKHPNVLTVHEVGTEGDRDFIVMELVDGGPLDQWLAFGPPEEEVMAALLAAGRGLAAAHAAGLVHRDFKPNNVLRSKDGRVLVTDFGLARGLGEDWSSPVSATGSLSEVTPSSRTPAGHDNVLDSTLTKTGMLLGTPAYMAPEQFAGAEPDPRTDQFAFCVTAWQALTGARPHHGRTLDELRQAAGKGVAGVVTQLPKQLRAVLARGLEPDPAKRWPDLVTLLKEIERAGRPPKSKWPWIAGGAVAAIAVVIAIVVATRSATEPTCEPVDAAWADAYAPAKLPASAQWLAPVLEDHRKRWIATYEQTCKVSGARPEGKLGCLRAVRDRIVAVTDVVARDPATHAVIDPFVLLPPPEVCNGKLAIPAFPDADRRARVLAVLATSITTPTATNLEAQAKATGWAPLVPMVAIASGTHRVITGDVQRGREELERAIGTVETSDPRLAAIARLGLLDASLRELARPEDYPGTKPETMHEEIARQLTYARSAVKAAGDEALLAGMLAMLEAQALADLAERSRRAPFDDAVERAREARKLLAAAGDMRRAAMASIGYAEIQLRRHDASVIGDAEYAALRAVELLETAKLPTIPRLDYLLGTIAFARGQTKAAHRSFDRATGVAETGRATGVGEIGRVRLAKPTGMIEGVVLGPDGKPVMNAFVVAWTGELHGDRLRAITDRSTFDGEIAETGVEGKFQLRVRSGSLVIAESVDGKLRAVPLAVSPGLHDVVLKLGPTGEVSGKIETAISAGVEAYARFSINENSWFVRVPIQDDTAFRITNLPPGNWQLGTIGRTGTATRRNVGGVATLTDAAVSTINKQLVWPGGRTIDVVVRGHVAVGATAWIFTTELAQRFDKRDDFDALAGIAFDVASSPLLPIGSDYTDAGRPAYVAGARHAVFVGEYTVHSACVAPSAAHDAKVTCKKIGPKDRAVMMELP